MQVSITQKELDAILFAADQVESALESAEDKEYCNDAHAALSCIYNFVKKAHQQREKELNFNAMKKIVRRERPDLNRAHVAKLARKLLNETK